MEDSAGIGVLVVDDEEGVRRSIHRALQRESYAIHLAEEGGKAVRMVQSEPGIEIVISDLKMPGMDGIETLEQIGGIRPDLTRIVLTGYATLESAIDATNHGIDGFLTKPFENEELRIRIRDFYLKKKLRQLVSPQIFEHIQRNPKLLNPRRQDATIVFVDIRGFTQACELAEPEALSRDLESHYYTPIGETIMKHNGIIDKHIGDGIMAIFGAPVSFEDDCLRAIRATEEIRQKIQSMSAELTSHRNGGLHELRIGVGVARGRVVAGLLGSQHKKEYTALGSTVNLASRLESTAAPGQILLSEAAHAQVSGRVEARALTDLKIKGFDKPVTAYELLRVL
ncbi:MAG: response regulator [Nitrospirae bacterium]|nr:response regulator [Nitrospirota bacterium]